MYLIFVFLHKLYYLHQIIFTLKKIEKEKEEDEEEKSEVDRQKRFRL